MAIFKKVKNHGFTRRGILKIIPIKLFLKWTILPWIIPVVSTIFMLMLEDGEMGKLELITSNWFLFFVGLFIILCFIIFPFAVVSYFTGVQKPVISLLDLIFLDIYELDVIIIGTDCYGVLNEVLFLNNYYTLDKGTLRFSKVDKNIFDLDLLEAGYTMDELREYIVGVHMYCLKRTKLPLKYIDITLTNKSRRDIYNNVEDIVFTYEKDTLPYSLPETTKALRKKYPFLVRIFLEERVEKNYKPFMDIFGQVQIGTLTKYDMNKKAICKIQISDREKALLLEHELRHCYDRYQTPNAKSPGRATGRIKIGDFKWRWKL